eukprot:TRINITY_DN666_c0_g1_i12.p1 TRINITY_DN666_c0_g1~~TRINITY_DN666_c0_g1_i12.p1  ORF type:complete len:361 (+),score=63.46 TRINITY_DN666_c0_g1_i12:981-2063(+)
MHKSSLPFFTCKESKMWYKINTYTMNPPDGPPLQLEKYQHSAVVSNNSMFVWGGRGEKKQDFSSDLLQYTFGTRTWARVCVKGKVPSPRWGHKAEMWNGKMYVIGGCDYVLNFNDLYRYNFDTETWKKVDTGGVNFDPRFFHTTCVVQNSMIIFGGRNVHSYLFNDLYQYNFREYQDAAPNTFYEDTLKMLHSPQFADLTFSFPKENNKCLYAHRGVLAARSDAFSRMFRSNMLEGKCETKNINVLDSFEIFEAILVYIYTSLTVACDHFLMDQLVELMLLADRFLLLHLKSVCEKYLKPFVNTKTVNHLYDIGERAKAEQLKASCVKFAVKYHDVFSPNQLCPGLVKDVDAEKAKGNHR